MADYQTIKGRLILFIKHLGIGQAKFEARCGLSNGYVNNIRKSITPEKLQMIARCNPELNTGWLMTGEGEMLKTTYTQNVHGGENISQTGNITVNSSDDAVMKILSELSAQRRLTEKAHEQIDRLLTIIESMQSK